MLVFTHIPRTGGTTVRAVLRKKLNTFGVFDSLASLSFLTDKQLNGYSGIATHCGHGIFSRVIAPHEKMIILREPVERIVSHYYYLRQCSESVSYASHYAKTQTLIQFVQNSNPAVLVGVENAQTWHLLMDKNISFRNRYKGVSRKIVIDEALANLKGYRYVGFTDSVTSLVKRIGHDRGWSIKESDIPKLQTSSHPNVSDLDDNVLDAIHTKVEMDIELYAVARSIFSESA